MKFYIVIRAYNEQDTIRFTLQSLVNQTVLPTKLVVVNDNSSDNTGTIIKEYVHKYDWISSVDTHASSEHQPGAKVIKAFYYGFETLDEDYDIICKFDADIIFPVNYIDSIAKMFQNDKKIGIAGGLPYIKNKGQWVFENIALKSHVRGPIKAYRKECFHNIGGLIKSIGWDTVDVLLAQYFGWKVQTDQNLEVKHLKPTGQNYSSKSVYLHGQSLYIMRYGIWLSLIAALKSAINKRSFTYFLNAIRGYFKAKKTKVDFVVNKDQGEFIRKLRWQNIRKRFF